MQNGNSNKSDNTISGVDKDNLCILTRQSSTGEQCSMVATTFRKREYPFGRGGTMASLAQKSQEDFQYLAEELEKMGSDYFRYVNGQDIKPSSAYISDVIILRDLQYRDQCMEILCEYGRSRRNGLFGISEEGNHIHVIHDCSYTNRSCRDIWINQVKPFGSVQKTNKPVKYVWQFNRTDWYDVFIYFFIRKRGMRSIYIRGESGKIPSDNECLRWTREFEEREMVSSPDCSDDNEYQQQKYQVSSRSNVSSAHRGLYEKKTYSAGKFAYIRQKTKALLKKYYVSPVIAICDVTEFREDDLLCDPKNKDYVQAACEDFGKDLNNMSLKELYNMLTDGYDLSKYEVNPNAHFISSMTYDNLENSLNVIVDLLKYQCNDDDHLITEFLTNLVNVIDRKIPKLNSFLVVSPPSGGKNFFFDMIFGLLLSYGQLGQANKHNLFAFQEAPNKRILLWNEPNYESSLTDTIKMMLGGDPYTVRVKNRMDTHVKRTPVIILTNNYVPFMCDLAFNNRIIQYRWNVAPFLKDYELKPHPMSFFLLLSKYNITFYCVFYFLCRNITQIISICIQSSKSTYSIINSSIIRYNHHVFTCWYIR